MQKLCMHIMKLINLRSGHQTVLNMIQNFCSMSQMPGDIGLFNIWTDYLLVQFLIFLLVTIVHQILNSLGQMLKIESLTWQFIFVEFALHLSGFSNYMWWEVGVSHLRCIFWTYAWLVIVNSFSTFSNINKRHSRYTSLLFIHRLRRRSSRKRCNKPIFQRNRSTAQYAFGVVFFVL